MAGASRDSRSGGEWLKEVLYYLLKPVLSYDREEVQPMNTQKSLFSSPAVSGAPTPLLRTVDRPDSVRVAAGSRAYADVDAYVERQRRRLHIPGISLAIVEGDRIVHRRGFGQARPGGEAPSPQTPFAIGSLSKSLTALAVMQLVEAGKIDLDAPVQRYLPWFCVADPGASARMTVRHLLNQTSGLPGSAGETVPADFDDSPDAAERQARTLSNVVLTRPVGSAFEYSNANYQLLGLIVEAASGEPFPDYVQQHILTPLAMSHSYTTQAEAKQNGLAVGHQFLFGMPVAAPELPIPPATLAGGGLIACAEDMARYLIAHLNGGRYGDRRVLSSAGIDELLRGVVDFGTAGLGPVERFLAKDVSLGQYGMGWAVDTIGQTKLVWHGGTLPDFGAYMALLPEQRKGVVLLFNACHHWMNPVLAEFGTDVTALLAGAQPPPLPFLGVVPWMLRGQLLIPALQMAGVVAILRQLRRWRLDPAHRPSGGRKWGRHIVLPLIQIYWQPLHCYRCWARGAGI